MPPPGTPGTPFFEGANVTEFLERYNDQCNDYYVLKEDKILKLPRYCNDTIKETVQSFKEWKEQDYAGLQKAMRVKYRDNDQRQLLYSPRFLEGYKNVKRTEKDNI